MDMDVNKLQTFMNLLHQMKIEKENGQYNSSFRWCYLIRKELIDELIKMVNQIEKDG